MIFVETGVFVAPEKTIQSLGEVAGPLGTEVAGARRVCEFLPAGQNRNEAKKRVVGYPLVNKQLDPENHLFLMETNLPTPIWQGRTVNLPEGKIRTHRPWFPTLYALFVGLNNWKLIQLQLQNNI